MTRNYILTGFTAALLLVGGIALGWYLHENEPSFLFPEVLVREREESEKPYLRYAVNRLHEKSYAPATLQIEKLLVSADTYNSYLYSSKDPEGRAMTGQLNIPLTTTSLTPVIFMLRGYVNPDEYSTGIGTKNAASVFANNGYITIAPDFYGVAGSDPEREDPWIARFEKPIDALTVLKAVEFSSIELPTEFPQAIENQEAKRPLGIWAHSNGGQIALTLLEITSDPIPTTLWAPVTAPFPYSILFYSDEHDDEGRAMRLWVHSLEHEYDLRIFSLSHFLNYLAGPLQLHHGLRDEAAPKTWSDEFVQKLVQENERRETATDSAVLAPIEYQYFEYPTANHNMVPNWNTAVTRDLAFFRENLLE